MPYIEEVGDIEEQEWAEAGARLLGERGGPSLYARHTLYWEFPRVGDSQWSQHGLVIGSIRYNEARIVRARSPKFSCGTSLSRTRQP